MIVCHCFGVSDCQIKNCRSLKGVRRETNATLGCGGCLPVVRSILKKKTEQWFIDAEADIETAVLAIDPEHIQT